MVAAAAIALAVPGTLWAQTTHDVTVGDSFFSPNDLTIEPGDTVRWNNAAGGLLHDVTADDFSFASQTASSFTYTQTFNSEGDVPYHCTVHSVPGANRNSNMNGIIRVQSSSEPDPADLAMTQVSAPSGSFPQGSAISVDAEVTNLGGTASGAFTINYYASTNASITDSDTLLGTENRSSLEAGEDSNGPVNVTIPANLPPGTYFIGAIVQINDANNSNNANADNETITVTAAGPVFLINNGLNDAWRSDATGGQGFFIIVYPDLELMFLAWFTYEVERPPEDVTAILGEPGHRWFTAFGNYSGDTAMLDIEWTEGGIFDDSPPVPTQTVEGTMTVTFFDCETGQIEYSIPSLGLSGTVPIRRVVGTAAGALANIQLCQAQQTP